MTRHFLDPRLAGLVRYVPGEVPRDGRPVIKLNTNENPFPPSPAVLQALSAAEAERLNLYPDPEARGLTRAIADRFGLDTGRVVTGNGSDELLAFCFHGFCPRGAVFADVTYGFYPVFCRMFGVPFETVPLRDDFSLNVDDYRGRRETVFLANPNAPTGLALALPDVRRLLEQDRDRLTVVDEAYVDFGAESAAPLLDEYDNLLVIRTFSKSRQLAGVRLAFALGSEPLAADLMTLKFGFNPYSVNAQALAAGEAALRDEAYFERTRREIMRNRETLQEGLKALGAEVVPSKANFVFTRPPADAASLHRILRERGILVRHFPDEPGGPARTGAWLRVSVGTAEQVGAFLDALRDILRDMRRGTADAAL